MFSINKKQGFTLGIVLIMAACINPSFALDALTDTDLAAVSGQSTATFDLEFRFNSDADGKTLGSCSGTATPTFVGGAGVNGLCSVGIQFANRTNEWMVLNGFSFLLKVNGLKMDGVRLALADSDTSKFNSSSFKDPVTGVCSLLGGVACTALNVGKLYALRFSPATAALSPDTRNCANSNCPSDDAYYKDLKMGLKINRLSVLTGSAVPTNANPENVVTISMGDQSGTLKTDLAKATWQGSVLIYGF
jgi:hypothetical protein